MFWKRNLLSLAVFLASGLGTAYADGDAALGESIANEACARCHVVSEARRFTGISSTPSFMGLVNYISNWEERFETFYARRPHPVHVRIEGIEPLSSLPSNAAIINLTLADVENLVAYARSLLKE